MKTKHCRSVLREGASDAPSVLKRGVSSDQLGGGGQAPALLDAARVLERDQSPDRSTAVKAGLDEETAVEEAKHCLAAVPCKGCDLCRLFCPDLCITRNAETGRIEIDYDFCKGCGICAAICPRGAINMVLEEH